MGQITTKRDATTKGGAVERERESAATLQCTGVVIAQDSDSTPLGHHALASNTATVDGGSTEAWNQTSNR